jgi:hypothetical protein
MTCYEPMLRCPATQFLVDNETTIFHELNALGHVIQSTGLAFKQANFQCALDMPIENQRLSYKGINPEYYEELMEGLQRLTKALYVCLYFNEYELAANGLPQAVLLEAMARQAIPTGKVTTRVTPELLLAGEGEEWQGYVDPVEIEPQYLVSWVQEMVQPQAVLDTHNGKKMVAVRCFYQLLNRLFNLKWNTMPFTTMPPDTLQAFLRMVPHTFDDKGQPQFVVQLMKSGLTDTNGLLGTYTHKVVSDCSPTLGTAEKGMGVPVRFVTMHETTSMAPATLFTITMVNDFPQNRFDTKVTLTKNGILMNNDYTSRGPYGWVGTTFVATITQTLPTTFEPATYDGEVVDIPNVEYTMVAPTQMDPVKELHWEVQRSGANDAHLAMVHDVDSNIATNKYWFFTAAAGKPGWFIYHVQAHNQNLAPAFITSHGSEHWNHSKDGRSWAFVTKEHAPETDWFSIIVP